MVMIANITHTSCECSVCLVRTLYDHTFTKIMLKHFCIMKFLLYSIIINIHIITSNIILIVYYI